MFSCNRQHDLCQEERRFCNKKPGTNHNACAIMVTQFCCHNDTIVRCSLNFMITFYKICSRSIGHVDSEINDRATIRLARDCRCIHQKYVFVQGLQREAGCAAM